MKKIFIIINCIFMCLLSACSNSSSCTVMVENTYEFTSYKVDMSGFDGMSSTDHQFRKILLPTLYEIMDNGGSGVFYVGYLECAHCQKEVKIINEAAKLQGIIVYYIDAYDEDYPLVDKTAYAKFKEKFYDFLKFDEEKGDRTIQTPMVFTLNNGEIEAALVGEKSLEDYRQIMECYK